MTAKDLLISVSRPAGVSPRFLCDQKNFSDIISALDSVGHVIVEDVFDAQVLSYSKKYAVNFFKKMDAAYQRKKFNVNYTISYFSNTYSFMPDAEGTRHSEMYMDMIGRSHIIDLLMTMLNGDIAAILGPIVRYVDPRQSLRHIGLHVDDHVDEYAEQGFFSKRSCTMWVPLCDIDSETPGLLLLSRGLRLIKNEENILLNRDGMDVTSLCLVKQPKRELTTDESAYFKQIHHQALQYLIETLGKDIYAPILKAGSVILFRSDVIHGSFCHEGLTRSRHSTDVRFIADFDQLANFKNRQNAYIYRKYIRETYDPFAQSTQSIPAQLAELEQELDKQHSILITQIDRLMHLRSRTGIIKRLRRTAGLVFRSLRLRA